MILHLLMVMNSVFPDDPAVQIKRVGVRMLHEEEGTDDNRVKNVRRVFKGIQLFYFHLELPLLQAEYI